MERLDPDTDEHLLLLGCGTGMDLAHLPADVRVTAIDLLPTMVERTRMAAGRYDRPAEVAIGDAHQVPFEDDAFEAVLLHLILSVVPDPGGVVSEAARVLAPDGRISLYDKFSPADGKPSLLRRAANPLARLLFADLNRPLEPMVKGTGPAVEDREPFLGGLYTVTIARPTGEADR
ncbi:MAG: class I SAM-dependent methyltransferase [Halanaeroarchaeum sp.]